MTPPGAAAVGCLSFAAWHSVTSGGGNQALSVTVPVSQPDGVPGDRSLLQGGVRLPGMPREKGPVLWARGGFPQVWESESSSVAGERVALKRNEYISTTFWNQRACSHSLNLAWSALPYRTKGDMWHGGRCPSLEPLGAAPLLLGCSPALGWPRAHRGPQNQPWAPAWRRPGRELQEAATLPASGCWRLHARQKGVSMAKSHKGGHAGANRACSKLGAGTLLSVPCHPLPP